MINTDLSIIYDNNNNIDDFIKFQNSILDDMVKILYVPKYAFDTTNTLGYNTSILFIHKSKSK